MADEANENEEQKEVEAGSSSMIRRVIVYGIVLLVPAILGLSVVKFVLLPAMSTDTKKKDPIVTGVIPQTAVPVDFENLQASVVPESSDAPSSLLIYSVSLVCVDQATATLVQNNLTHFKAMLDKLHGNKTRSELHDPTVKSNIIRQVLSDANVLLKRLRPEESFEVFDAKHFHWIVLTP